MQVMSPKGESDAQVVVQGHNASWRPEAVKERGSKQRQAKEDTSLRVQRDKDPTSHTPWNGSFLEREAKVARPSRFYLVHSFTN